MKGFLLGVIVGAVGTYWYTQRYGQLEVNQRFGEMQDRANAVLNESRHILEETRQELSSALEAGKLSVQQRTERLRRPTGEAGETNPTGGSEANQSGT